MMGEKDMEAKDIEQKVHDLASAMQEVKTASADREDVVVELRQSKASRLELLADDLSPVFNDVPADQDQFEFALTNGDVPRLWIDMTSFVRMAKDGRVYEFVKDTRLGRTILGSSKNREKMGAQITRYVAERMLERERAMEGEWVSLKQAPAEMDESADVQEEASEPKEETLPTAASPEEASATTVDAVEPAVKSRRSLGLLATFIWFLLGLVVGLCVFATALVFDAFQPLVQWIAGIGQ
ncbi:MAG: hypothetical protein AAF412_04185 [Pseudomonadota bacterium]